LTVSYRRRLVAAFCGFSRSASHSHSPKNLFGFFERRLCDRQVRAFNQQLRNSCIHKIRILLFYGDQRFRYFVPITPQFLDDRIDLRFTPRRDVENIARRDTCSTAIDFLCNDLRNRLEEGASPSTVACIVGDDVNARATMKSISPNSNPSFRKLEPSLL
jgi:hypothetical protein